MRRAPIDAKTALFEACEPRRLFAAIASGQRVDATIGSAQEIDSYTINVGSTAPLLVVNVATTSGNLNAVAEVLDPDGDEAEILHTEDGVTYVDASDESGTYTVRVRAGTGGQSGGYRLSVFSADASVQVDDDSDDFSDTRDDVSIESGRRYAATTGPGDIDVFRVDATAGQTISVTAGRNASASVVDPLLTLIAPDGSIVSRDQQRIIHRAEQSGRYFAIVTENGNDETEVYGISFARVAGPQYEGDPDTAPLAAGTSRGGDLPAGDTDVYSIFMEPGATLDVDMNVAGGTTTAGFVPTLQLYGPDGRPLRNVTGTSAGVDLNDFSTDVGGTYFLVLRDDDQDGGGEFTIRYDLSTGGGLGGTVEGGTLLINGSGGDDVIRIRERENDDYDVLTVEIDGDGKDFFAGEVRRIEVQGNDGDDRIDIGTLSLDGYLSGGRGNDTIQGGSGDDALVGGAGGNRLMGGDGNDRLSGSNGRDFLFGEGGNDRMYGNGGNDFMDGGGNVDRLYGGDGDDQMFGGSSNDRVYAEAGNDTLAGGKGLDYLFGGTGTDTVFNGGADGDILDSIENT